jgi:hypothetical protein
MYYHNTVSGASQWEPPQVEPTSCASGLRADARAVQWGAGPPPGNGGSAIMYIDEDDMEPEPAPHIQGTAGGGETEATSAADSGVRPRDAPHGARTNT